VPLLPLRPRLAPALRRSLLSALGVACLLWGSAVQAQTLRVATAFDPNTMDPHAIALLYHSRVVTQIYDSLINRNEQFALEPSLALSWAPVDPARPSTWRLQLRPGVRFHDGTVFTADDAVFSLQRALAPSSQRAFQLQGVKAVRKLDALGIELELDGPDAVLPEKLIYIAMMSRAWAQRHGVTLPQDFNAKQETHAVRNAMGTGPFRLERYEADARVLLRRHTDWWGASDPAQRPRNGNVQEVQFVTIRADATRLAALASGEVDMVLDPPYQDIQRLQRDGRIKLLQTTDIGQQYLTFDHASTELRDSDVKGRNPFKDRRVRQAVQLAINVPLIVDKVLRGQAQPTGAMLSPLVDGTQGLADRQVAHDPVRARALLAEAGYPQGFAVTLDCVNVAWREAVCQAASAMLTQVGIRTTLRSSVSNLFFPRLTGGQISFAEFGWTPTTDASFTLNALFHTWSRDGRGTFNAGRYSNPELDARIDSIRHEPDVTRRRALVRNVLERVADEVVLVPLYRRTLTWAMNPKISVVQWPSDTMELRWVRRAP